MFGAVEIARRRTEEQAKNEAAAKLQAEFRETLMRLAQARGKWVGQAAN